MQNQGNEILEILYIIWNSLSLSLSLLFSLSPFLSLFLYIFERGQAKHMFIRIFFTAFKRWIFHLLWRHSFFFLKKRKIHKLQVFYAFSEYWNNLNDTLIKMQVTERERERERESRVRFRHLAKREKKKTEKRRRSIASQHQQTFFFASFLSTIFFWNILNYQVS